MRMNDIHDAWGGWYSPFLFPPIKREHPDWLMGTEDKRPVDGAWSAVDYGRPEVRDLAFQFFEEVCNNYDVDGVEMDFFRHLTYFRKHAWGEPVGQEELDMMTDLFRRIRTMADEAAVKKGHPILISVRVPDSVELCKAVGFDIERWMAEDLIDIMVVSGYFRLNYWDVSAKLGHKHGVPVYACLSETRMKDAEAHKTRASLASYRARAINAWYGGVDGVYMFNYFNPNSPLWHEVGALDTLAGLDKVYTTGARGTGNLDFWYTDGERFVNRSLLSPCRARKLAVGQTETVDLLVGEDLRFGKGKGESEGEAGAATPKVTLQLRVQDLAKPDDLAVTLNGAQLAGGVQEGLWVNYALAPAQVKQGMNRFDIALNEGAQGSPVLQDLLLWVRYGEAAKP